MIINENKNLRYVNHNDKKIGFASKGPINIPVFIGIIGQRYKHLMKNKIDWIKEGF